MNHLHHRRRHRPHPHLPRLHHRRHHPPRVIPVGNVATDLAPMIASVADALKNVALDLVVVAAILALVLAHVVLALARVLQIGLTVVPQEV